MNRKISRIVFTGDSFRSVLGDPDQIGNVKWLYNILSPLLIGMTNINTEIRLPLVGERVQTMYELLGISCVSLDAWARVFASNPSDDLVTAIKDELGDAVIVSIELPPILVEALNAAGVPWIDVGVSPLRFLPDLALHVRASEHFDLHAAPETLLTPECIQSAVLHVQRHYGIASLPPGSVVFFAQTANDRTLIHQGRFFGISDLEDYLATIFRSANVFVKPHPWEKEAPVVRKLISEGAQLIDANTYAIISNRSVDVITISSSVGREARVFGRAPTILAPKVQDWAFSGVDVLQAARSASFWAPLLNSAGINARYVADTEWAPNQLRKTIPMQGMDYKIWERDIRFYERSFEERIALTQAAIDGRRTLLERWAVLDDTEGEHWNARSAFAARLLEDQPSVTEFGCGMMYLEKYLKEEQYYCPSDVVQRDGRTLVCDLNKESVPLTSTTAVAMLGVLEYLFDVPRVLAEAAQRYQVMVVSYCVTDASSAPKERREHAWVNAFSTSELEAIFTDAGWNIQERHLLDSWQSIWRLSSNFKSDGKSKSMFMNIGKKIKRLISV